MSKLRKSTICTVTPHPTLSNPPHILPIYATSSFEFDSAEESIQYFSGEKLGHMYSRYGNPTVQTVATHLAQLEAYGSNQEAYCMMAASGMAAIHSCVTALLKPGDVILTHQDLYGGTVELFEKIIRRGGIEIQYADFNDLSEIESCLHQNPAIQCIYIETPSNPLCTCYSIREISNIAQKRKCITILDNTFATPYVQQPLLLGVDYVLHSTTKNLNGHGNGMGGAIISFHKEIMQGAIFQQIKLNGAMISPFEAWLVSQGMKTLHLRMERNCANALEIAQRLSKSNKVSKVNYPGLPIDPSYSIAKSQMTTFGSMLSFYAGNSRKDALKFMNNVTLIKNVPTLGEVNTILLHPDSSSHLRVDAQLKKKMGITDHLIRISVGIEDVEDIWNDMENALKSI